MSDFDKAFVKWTAVASLVCGLVTGVVVYLLSDEDDLEYD